MKKNKRPLKVAMIGVGDITTLHYPAYCEFEHAELTAICDLDETLLRQRRSEWKIDRAVSDYRSILDDREIDIIEVNTPHHLHEKFVVEALEAGKHVACQKPMSTTIAAAQAMLEAEKRNPGKLRIMENFVFYPPYVKAKELLEAGEIGTPLSIRFKLGTGLVGSRWVPLKSELWHLLESEKGMGQAVFDDGYHKLSMAIHLIGNIESVKGFIDRSFVYIDEPAQLIWRYKDLPTLGSFDIAFTPNLYTKSKYFGADERIDIIGTRGMMHLSCCTGRITDDPPLILYRDGRRVLYDELETDWQASFNAAIRDFPLAIIEGRETLISAERALDIMKFAFALITAAKRGREVRPDEITDEMIGKELLGPVLGRGEGAGIS